MPTLDRNKSRRIYELDLLRGFFIVVIILDHLQFFPSPWQYMTGQGRLWVSAAEGFFLISGLLVGYLRAYKGSRESLRDLSTKLWKRAALLYAWCVLITLFVISITYLIPSNDMLLPKLPEASQMSSIWVLLANIISTNYASDWIYFLRLYAIMLAITPLFLWLLRHKLWWVAALISLCTYTASLLLNINEGAMQWQVLFFGAALVGWKFEVILAWLQTHLKVRRILIGSLITLTISSMVLSYFFVHGWGYVESPATSITREAYISVRANIDPLFSNNPLEPSRIALSFLWFAGLLSLFHVAKKFIMKYFGWLLLGFGASSLTAYCLQAIVLSILLSYISPTPSFWINGIVGVFVILLIWSLLRIPLITKLLPR